MALEYLAFGVLHLHFEFRVLKFSLTVPLFFALHCTEHFLCMSTWTQKAGIHDHDHDHTMIMNTSGVYNDLRNELMISFQCFAFASRSIIMLDVRGMRQMTITPVSVDAKVYMYRYT